MLAAAAALEEHLPYPQSPAISLKSHRSVEKIVFYIEPCMAETKSWPATCLAFPQANKLLSEQTKPSLMPTEAYLGGRFPKLKKLKFF